MANQILGLDREEEQSGYEQHHSNSQKHCVILFHSCKVFGVQGVVVFPEDLRCD